MNRIVRFALGSATLGASAIGLAGCGGAGPQSDTAQSDAARTEAQSPDKPKPKSEDVTTAEKRTPESGIDVKKAVDVVKAEVKGGESDMGPTPVEFLFQSPSKPPEPGEALTVEVPLGLEPIASYIPAANPLTKAKVELGKQLYFDQRISKDATVSCATCHNPAKGWTDRLSVSMGIEGQTGGRSAPTVLNTVYGKTMFWDGRAPSLEGQAQGPIQNKIEMGDQSYKQIVERLRGIPGYQEQFQKVFGTPVTLDGMAKAIAAFERTALSGGSAYDRYVGGEGAEPDLKALTDEQKRGMVLFGLALNPDDTFEAKVERKKANCTSCHAGFNFTDEAFHNLGIGFDEKSKKFEDLGRWEISPVGSKLEAEKGAFKTPTIRDAENTAPYMHDGSLATLEDVVEHYNKGGTPNPFLDKDMPKLKLIDQEKKDVVAFMKALTGKPIAVALPMLPPGPDGKPIDPSAALTPPGPKLGSLDGIHRFTR